MFSNVKQVMAEKLALQVSQKKGVYGKNPARLNVTTELNSWVCLTIGYPCRVPQISWLSCFFIFFVAAVLKLLFEELSPPDKPSLLWVFVVTCFLSIESPTFKILKIRQQCIIQVLHAFCLEVVLPL